MRESDAKRHGNQKHRNTWYEGTRGIVSKGKLKGSSEGNLGRREEGKRKKGGVNQEIERNYVQGEANKKW